MTRAAVLAPVVAALLWCAASGRASAEPKPRAELDVAIGHFARGELDAATDALRRLEARDLSPPLKARVCLYIGLIAAVEQRDREAGDALARAFSYDPNITLDPQRFKPSLVALVRRVQRETTGEIVIEATGPPRRVLINGETVGSSPMRRRLPPGAHLVEIKLETGKRSYSRRVTLRAGQSVRLLVASTPSDDRGAEAATATSKDAAPAPASGRSVWRRHIWSLGLLAGGVASSAVAIGLGLSARSSHEEACGMLAYPSLPCEERYELTSVEERERYNDLAQRVDSRARLANISWGIAGAFLAAAVVSFFLERRAAKKSVGVSLSSRYGGGSLHLLFDLRFEEDLSSW